jgi:hypothetical protein
MLVVPNPAIDEREWEIRNRTAKTQRREDRREEEESDRAENTRYACDKQTGVRATILSH